MASTQAPCEGRKADLGFSNAMSLLVRGRASMGHGKEREMRVSADLCGPMIADAS
jgi:hypothetical protein